MAYANFQGFCAGQQAARSVDTRRITRLSSIAWRELPRIGVLCLISSSAFAQNTQATEEQRRRAQQEAQERLERQQAPDLRWPAAPYADGGALDLPDEAPCFRIDRLQVDGERLADFAWLPEYLAGYAGRCIGEQGINRIVRRASARILADGYITTRLAIPEQQLAGGTLRLTLVPGVVRAVRIVGDAPERSWRSAFSLRPGDLLQLCDLEQGLEQMQRLASQDVSIDIAPGDAPGESDIVLTITRGKPWRVALLLDNSGVEATGRTQASVNATLDNPLGINDQLSVGVNVDTDQGGGVHGTRGRNVAYSLPWGEWTASLAASTSFYQQTVAGVNQSFVASGDAQNQELKLQRVVYRDQSGKTTLQGRILRRSSRSYIEDSEIAVQRRHTVAAEVGVVQRQYLGAVQFDLALAYRQGVPWFGGQHDAPGHAADAPTFDYRLQTLDLTASAPFALGGQRLRWLATLHGQRTRDVLYAADDLAIGNRYTVRGFDGERTLAGGCGWFLRNEIEVPFADSGQAAYVGIDHGEVGGRGTPNLAGRQLTGAVVGVRGGGYGFAYDVFVGWAIAKPDALVTARPTLAFQLSYPL